MRQQDPRGQVLQKSHKVRGPRIDWGPARALGVRVWARVGAQER